MTQISTSHDGPQPSRPTGPARRIHPAWWVAFVAFLTIIGAAGFRSTPGVLMQPLHDEFGWSHATIGAAVSVNLVLFGLGAPFSAALMERFGVPRIVCLALGLVALGSALPVFMTQSWQLLLCWGVLVGLGTGAMSMSLVATITNRWFVHRRGLVSGLLTASSATGQLIFLPILAWLSETQGWRTAALLTALVALAVIPLVMLRLPDAPGSIGITPYGAPPGTPIVPAPRHPGAARLALTSLRDALRSQVFWLLAGSFAICGMSTNGLIQTHFVPAAHDHGMAPTAAASLLALVGIFDIVGTVFSGWLTDRFDPRILLALYYLLRGVSLFVLPSLFAPSVEPNMFVFIVFYGLDWVATVPPTMALCREYFGERAPIVFGWIFASHQLGAAVAAWGAGLVRDLQGDYQLAWQTAGVLCLIAAIACLAIRKSAPALTGPDPVTDQLTDRAQSPHPPEHPH